MAGGKGGKGSKDENEKLRPIIIKRIKKAGGGHHGGAWKVAYADFVTAMMAFFLLLWLLNVTTEQQKNAISDYFDPSHPKVSDVVSGSGGVMGGMTMSVDGAMVSNVQPLVQQNTPDTTTRGTNAAGKPETGEGTKEDKLNEEQLEAEFRKKEDEKFKQAAEQLKAEIAKSPELQALQKNLLIDITPEGLRIQIVDDQGRSMFPSGSAKMYDFMHLLLLKVSGVIKPMTNQVSVRGHTDSNKYKDPSRYDNWNLSADRAQASRRVLVEGGLPEVRVENVMGRADRDPFTKDPQDAKNRRISIILIREAVPHSADKKAATPKPATNAPAGETPHDTTTNATSPKAVTKPGLHLQIIDDTKPAPTPAPTAAKNGTSGNGVAASDMPDRMTPLPTTAGGQSAIKRQPQIVEFGGDTSDAPAAPLYQSGAEGETAAPVQSGPPTIHKRLFDFGSDGTEDTKAAKPAVIPDAPAAPANAQEVTFDDAPAAPLKPLAPAALPPESSTNSDGSKKVLEFGE